VPFLVSTLGAQNPPDAPAAPQQQELHWAIKLGLRSHQVGQAFPLVDRVVLVPDAATYVDELSKWSPRGRWPVLFDEPRFASMFIRKFQPAEVIRRASVGSLSEDAHEREKQLENVVVLAWGGDPALLSIEETFTRHSFSPPGVVVTSVSDPAWTAGVAFAAGHGQPLLFLDGNFGEDRGVGNDNILQRFNDRFEAMMNDVPYTQRELGDEIDAVTICRAIAPRLRLRGEDVQNPGGYAFTDSIARNPDNSRWAFTGWIFGDNARCAYVAMSSLFLDRTEALLLDTYPDDVQWQSYSLTKVNLAMRQIGFTPTLHDRNWMTIDNWLRMLPGGITADVVFVNSRGLEDFFELASGRGYACDAPILNTPAAVHFIHSFSMNAPHDPSTVAGRWIEHGAYAFVGSVVEPTLGGFVPPMIVTERMVNFVPFLIAARHWENVPAEPGKIATYGDPLMLIALPEKMKKERISTPREDGVNLLERVRELMEQIKEEPTAERYAEAIADLVMLGKDDIAAELWVHARQAGHAALAADHALGALFRLQRRDEFMHAWDVMGTRTDHDIDMLWSMWTSHLAGANDDTLLQLQSAVRLGQPEVDLERLLPHLERAFGKAHAARVVDREIEKSTNDRTRKKLRDLIR